MELLTLNSIEDADASGRLDLRTGSIRILPRTVADKIGVPCGLFGHTQHGATALYRYGTGLWLQNEQVRLRLRPGVQAGVMRDAGRNVLVFNLDAGLRLAMEYAPGTVDFGTVVARIVNDPLRHRTFFLRGRYDPLPRAG